MLRKFAAQFFLRFLYKYTRRTRVTYSYYRMDLIIAEAFGTWTTCYEPNYTDVCTNLFGKLQVLLKMSEKLCVNGKLNINNFYMPIQIHSMPRFIYRIATLN